MLTLLIIIHVIICVVLILAVMLQSGKAADLAGAFGGVGSQTAFGPRGAQSLLGKITTVCAVLFMITSLGLWILQGKTSSVVKNMPAKETPAAAQTQKPAQEKTAAATTKNPPAKTEQKSEAPTKK
ncbi:MAG: preprotein translocase subunit SecG [Candidatus Aminicenantes bacterium]|nr:preprotein translocase subunit SecG [Candidatus Aminicenantes bacterium]